MLNEGDIVQLNPETVRNMAFAGCFMTVTEPKPWGAQGYVQAVGNNRDQTGGQAFYRATLVEMSPPLGTTYWMIDRGGDSDAQDET